MRTTGPLLLVLRTLAPLMGNPDLGVSIDVSTADLVLGQADFMFEELTGDEDRRSDQ